MIRKGRLTRLAELGGLAAGLASDVAHAGASLATDKVDAVAHRLHERTARRLAASMGAMKALPMKVGQLLSYVDEIVPPAQRALYQELLGPLRAGTEPLPWYEPPRRGRSVDSRRRVSSLATLPSSRRWLWTVPPSR